MRRLNVRRHSILLGAIALSSLVAIVAGCGADSPDMIPEAPPDATEMSAPREAEPAPADPEKPDLRDETADALDEGETFHRVDRDRDRRLSRDEVAREGVPVVINTWDVDRDGDLAGEEVYAIFFDTLDTDDSDSLSFEELNASDDADGAVSEVAFERSDANRDHLLDRKEARRIIDQKGTAASWDPDADGSLNPHEVLDYVYATWDSNDDGFLDDTEWLVVP